MSKLDAINGTVFVRRDDKEAEIGGVHVSEGAQVGSMYGEIVAIDDCPYAKIGDRVHIPHYGVLDVDYDGETYAMFKKDRLFFVNGEPVNGYAIVRKCENDHIRDESGEIAIYMTENHIEYTNWVEILGVADDCDKLKDSYKGLYCVAPENDEKLARIGRGTDFCLHESLVEFLTEG